MNDPIDLYRQIKAVQKQAERAGFAGTATALAVVAEMMALEAGTTTAMNEPATVTTVPWTLGALPIYRMAQY